MAEAILDQLLFRIEEIEVRSLIWGYVDGALSRQDVSQLAQDIAPGEDPEDLIEDLIDRRLLFEVSDDGLRSRFAEGVRLFARLRQLFRHRPWQTAPRLVSDFRVDLRPRRYPDRDPNRRGRRSDPWHLRRYRQRPVPWLRCGLQHRGRHGGPRRRD